METKDLPVNRKQSISVNRLLQRMRDDLELEVLAGFQGLGRPVLSSDVNRPGLALGGYLDFFANDRIQILGNTEVNYMNQLKASTLQSRLYLRRQRACPWKTCALMLKPCLPRGQPTYTRQPLPWTMTRCLRSSNPCVRKRPVWPTRWRSGFGTLSTRG